MKVEISMERKHPKLNRNFGYAPRSTIPLITNLIFFLIKLFIISPLATILSSTTPTGNYTSRVSFQPCSGEVWNLPGYSGSDFKVRTGECNTEAA